MASQSGEAAGVGKGQGRPLLSRCSDDCLELRQIGQAFERVFESLVTLLAQGERDHGNQIVASIGSSLPNFTKASASQAA
jgi:hypothetical protein